MIVWNKAMLSSIRFFKKKHIRDISAWAENQTVSDRSIFVWAHPSGCNLMQVEFSERSCMLNRVTKELPLQMNSAHCHKGGSRWGLSLWLQKERERETRQVVDSRKLSSLSSSHIRGLTFELPPEICYYQWAPFFWQTHNICRIKFQLLHVILPHWQTQQGLHHTRWVQPGTRWRWLFRNSESTSSSLNAGHPRPPSYRFKQ